ncbi:MAG: hypothetical protein Q9227_003794 [Pyrenula ochraceoflavens]
MAADNLTNPNAIPERTSSSGVVLSPSHQPSKPVLKPLPEDQWVSPNNRMSTPAAPSTTVNGNKTAPGHHPTSPVNIPPRRNSKRTSDPANLAAALQSPPKDTKTSHSRKPSNMAMKSNHDGELWSNRKEKILLGPYEYLLSHPGKDIRTQLIHAFNNFLHVPAESLATITKITGMLHTSSLLVDDVEDSSVLRRGVPVAHSIFGVAQTINSANYVYFLALQEITTLRNKDACSEIFISEMINLHRGQGLDLFWRDTLTCPTEDEYLEMVQNKTGGLFRLAVKLMQAESYTTRHDYVPLVNLMGLIFQICDDYLNLSSGTYTKNKGLCEDLTEGKFSFPVIHSIRASPDNLQLINILKQKTKDEQVKRYAVSYMESTGSFEYTKGVIRGLKAKAHELLATLDPEKTESAEVRSILDLMDVE